MPIGYPFVLCALWSNSHCTLFLFFFSFFFFGTRLCTENMPPMTLGEVRVANYLANYSADSPVNYFLNVPEIISWPL